MQQILRLTLTSVNDATYLAGWTLDTTLYLGDSSSGNWRPTINVDYGLFFEGEDIAYIEASNNYNIYSNELRYDGSTLTMWVYIFDGERDQILACKQNRDSGTDQSEKVCLGMKDGYFYGTVYNETLQFDANIEEGWNFIALILSLDSTSSYTRLRVVAYSRSRVVAAYQTFSYNYQDDVDYDLVIGAKWDYDGLNVTKGMAGYLLEVRLYSTSALSLEDLDGQIDWDCTSNTAQKLCDFCPAYITTTTNVCLEDYITSRTNTNYLVAKYAFTGTPTGLSRYYYRSSYNGYIYDFYLGAAPEDARQKIYEPHRSEVNGLYFDGNDYISQAITGASLLNFNNYFTIELWCRFTESTPSQNYYLFQKVNTFGTDFPFFQFYFSATNKSFMIEMNSTVILDIPNAYDSETFPQQWVFIGVSFASLYQPANLDEGYYRSKVCAYIWGPNGENSGCSIVNDYYDETWERPYQWDTRMGKGLVGFIRNVYIWKTYKSLTHLYYTPARNYPIKDQCSPFTAEGYPNCFGCDQYLASSTCFSSCVTNSYAANYNQCLNYNCTNDLCTSCYADNTARDNNYCTSCIANAELMDGSLGSCKCKKGYYLDEAETVCKACHPACDSCSGEGNGKCYKCNKGYPYWEGYCLNDCGEIGYPYNLTYIYSEKLNTCTACYDFYYTINWKECTAQPYPISLTAYNNQYMILSFTQPVKYTGKTTDELFQISISGDSSSYDFTWSVPYWESGQYSKDIFIQLKISDTLKGNEKIYLYMDNIYVTDSRNYVLLARNTTSKSEFLPLSAKLVAQDYISASEKAIITSAGTGVIISLLITLAFNVLIAFLSSGSMELLWSFLNVVQIMNYIPNLNLNYPSLMIMMFQYLSIANSDITILANMFAYVFNLNDDTFPDDTYIHSNFNRNGYSSMKIVMNLQSQMAIVVIFTVCFALGVWVAAFEQSFIWNALLRFYLESFLEINTSAYINVLSLDFSDPLNTFCSTLSILLLCVSILFPVFSCFFLFQFRHKLHDEQIKARYGAVYEEYQFKKWYQYMHATFFIARPWIVIGIVIIMVLINLFFIFPYKIYETVIRFRERARIQRLKTISEVEQKYLFFDYKKFFLSTLTLHASKQPRPPSPDPKKEEIQVRPTQVYNPSEDGSEESQSEADTNSERIPPEPYSTNQPLNLKNDRALTPENPLLESEQQPIYQESQYSPRSLDDNDRMNPDAINMDSRYPPNNDNIPGFQWMQDIPQQEQPNFYNPNEEDDGPQQYLNSPYTRNQQPFSETLTEPNGLNPRRKKIVSFQDPNNQLSNTDGFKQIKKPKQNNGGFFDTMVNQSDQSEEIFKSEEQDANNRNYRSQNFNQPIWNQR